MSSFAHRTVLCDETLEAIQPRSGGVYVDVTAGGGGHSHALLSAAGPGARLFAFDRDSRAVAASRERLQAFGEQALVQESRFSGVEALLKDQGLLGKVDGLIADLGVSSPQLDHADRGFSFMEDAPLDMRMDDSGPTVLDLIDSLDEEELASVFYENGEIRASRRLARAVKEARAAGELERTRQLSALCSRVLGSGRRSIDPATLPFQALRIALNREFEEIDTLLQAIPRLMAPGGRVAIITFHSLEDRRVKHAFRDLSSPPAVPRHLPLPSDYAEPEFRRIGSSMTPGAVELQENPRSRSARLRVIERRVPREDA